MKGNENLDLLSIPISAVEACKVVKKKKKEEKPPKRKIDAQSRRYALLFSPTPSCHAVVSRAAVLPYD